MFIKYRREWAGGVDAWEYAEIFCPKGWTKKKTIEEFENELASEANRDGDYHYRGVEVVEIKRLPKEYLKREIKYLRSKIFNNTEQLNRYKKMLTWK